MSRESRQVRKEIGKLVCKSVSGIDDTATQRHSRTRDTAAPDTRCRREEHQQSKLEHVVIVFQKNETNFYCFLIANDTNFAFQRHAQRSRFVTSTEILTNINGIGKNK